MPRPDDVSLGAPAAYGPTDTPKTQLNVVAPLDVTAAPTQGQALAKALGLANETLQAPLKKMQIAEGRNDAAVGQADALNGNVDPDKMKAISGYAAGVNRMTWQQNTIATLNDLQTKANTPTSQGGWGDLALHDQTGANGNVVPGLLTTADAYLKQQLGGLEKDPEAARVMAPLIQRAMNEMAGQKVQEQIQQTRENASNTAQASAIRQAQANDGSFDWSDQFKVMTDVYMGDKSAAMGALVHSVGQAMIQAHDPTLLDKLNIPDKITFTDKTGTVQTIDGPMYTAKNSAVFDEAKAKALELQTKDHHQMVMQTENGITADAIQDKDIQGSVLKYLQMPGADPHFAMTILNFQKNRDKEGIDDEMNSPRFASVIQRTLTGDITSAPQLVQAVQDAHLGGKAVVTALTKGMDALRATQTTDQDDPDVRGGVAYLDGMYKPGTNPLTGKFNNPQAVTQHSGILMDYRTEVQKKIQQGTPAAEASQSTIQDLRKKWGDPVEISGKPFKAPQTDIEKATAILDAIKSPEHMATLNLTGSDIKRLRDIGYLSSGDAEMAARIALSKHQ